MAAATAARNHRASVTLPLPPPIVSMAWPTVRGISNDNKSVTINSVMPNKYNGQCRIKNSRIIILTIFFPAVRKSCHGDITMKRGI